MQSVNSLTLTDRFACIIGVLCEALARRGRPSTNVNGPGPYAPLAALPGPLIVLIWNRLRRYVRRFTSLVNRGPIKPRVRPSRAGAQSGRPPKPVQTPRGYAWLLHLVPEAVQARAQLRHLLADPEMMALLEADPGLCRILRPLCHMLAISKTETGAPPVPPLRRRARTAQPPPSTLPPPAPPPASPLDLSTKAA